MISRITIVSVLCAVLFGAFGPIADVPPPMAAGVTNMFDAKIESEKLVQDGKSLYASGQFDEAEAKLIQALKLNPDNQAANYYLNLVEQQKYSNGLNAGERKVQAANLQAILTHELG